MSNDSTSVSYNEKAPKVSKILFGLYVLSMYLNICVTSFFDSLELLESEQEKAESDCAIHQNQCSQSGLTRNNNSSPLHRPSLPDPLLICSWVLKNQFGKIWFNELDFQSISNLIFIACVASNNQFRNWFLQAKNPVHRNWFLQINISKIKYRSTGGQKITSGGCINKPLLTLNGKSINEADDDDVLHAIT